MTKAKKTLKISTNFRRWIILFQNPAPKTIPCPARKGFALILACILLLAAGVSGCRKAATPPTQAISAQPSPGADEIIYTSAGTLFATDLAGNPAEKLEGSSGRDWFPAISPDDTQLAFWSSASGAFELWQMDLSSGKRRQLTYFNEASIPTEMQNFSLHNAPAWSPDGKRLAFSFYGKLWVIEASGFNLETILPEGQNLSPAWSPDGTFLAYIAERAHKGRNLYLLKLGTSETWVLTNFPTTQWVSGPTWSPLGKVLAFTVTTGEETDIWTIHADGSHLTRLTQDKHSHSPAWAPDGKHLAFASGRQDLQHWEIWIMNTDGSGAFSLTRNGGFSPTWRRIQSSNVSAPHPVANLQGPLSKVKSAASAPQAPVVRASQAPATRVPQAPVARAPQTAATRVPQAPMVRAPQVPAAQVAGATLPPVQAPVKTAKPLVPPTALPTRVAAKPTAVFTPKAQPVPTQPPVQEQNYDEYEQYAEADKSVLPDLNIAEDKDAKTGPRIVYTPKIDFYFAKDLIKPSSFPMLSQLAEELAKNPEAPLVVQGQPHGPALLRAMLGKSLSRARANSVLRHLIVTEKIKQINVTAIGEGDEFPDLGKRPADQPVLLVVIK